jgi:hypothetical protein
MMTQYRGAPNAAAFFVLYWTERVTGLPGAWFGAGDDKLSEPV